MDFDCQKPYHIWLLSPTSILTFLLDPLDPKLEVKLSLPKLAYWQFVKGRGKFLSLDSQV